MRDEKRKALHGRVRGAVHELSFSLGPNDPFWLSFGFNLPGAKEVPPAPENVAVVHQNEHAAAIQWDRPPRAKYYHVFTRVVGVDTEFVLAGTPRDRNFIFEKLPLNVEMEVVVTALNSGGESVKSKSLKIVTRQIEPSAASVP